LSEAEKVEDIVERRLELRVSQGTVPASKGGVEVLGCAQNHHNQHFRFCMRRRKRRKTRRRRTHHLRRFVLPLIDKHLKRRINRCRKLRLRSETPFNEGERGVSEGDEVGDHLGVLRSVEDEGETGGLRGGGR
jgi:hypothetical protein